MKASQTRLGWRRALCVVLLLAGVQFVPLSSLGAHPDLWIPPIPYPGAGNDTLATIHRDWDVNGSRDPRDLVGRAADPGAGEVAFRMIHDIAAFEGVIAAPDQNQVVQPLAHVGIRWHAVTFEPPLHFPGNRTLARVTPGALNWSAPVRDGPLTGADPVGRLAWTSIPVPTDGSSSPDAQASSDGHVADATAPLWLALSVSFTDEPRADPDVGTRSTAIARFAAAVWVNRSVLHNPVTLFDTKARFTFHHDFGAVASGLAASADGPVNATGLYLQRDQVHTTARILDASHAWADAHNVTGRSIPALTSYDVPAYGRLPRSTPTSLLSPITLNVTVPMPAVRANITAWSLPSGPTVSSSGHGAIVMGETGFLAQAPLIPAQNDTEPEAPGPDPPAITPGPAVAGLLLLVAVMAVLGRLSTQRRTRKP